MIHAFLDLYCLNDGIITCFWYSHVHASSDGLGALFSGDLYSENHCRVFHVFMKNATASLTQRIEETFNP